MQAVVKPHWPPCVRVCIGWFCHMLPLQVLDLSCRRRGDEFVVVTDRWTRFTDFVLTYDLGESGGGGGGCVVILICSMRVLPWPSLRGLHMSAKVRLLWEDHVGRVGGAKWQVQLDRFLSCTHTSGMLVLPLRVRVRVRVSLVCRRENVKLLEGYCDEFLVHGVDVEGKRCGIDVRPAHVRVCVCVCVCVCVWSPLQGSSIVSYPVGRAGRLADRASTDCSRGSLPPPPPLPPPPRLWCCADGLGSSTGGVVQYSRDVRWRCARHWRPGPPSACGRWPGGCFPSAAQRTPVFVVLPYSPRCCSAPCCLGGLHPWCLLRCGMSCVHV